MKTTLTALAIALAAMIGASHVAQADVLDDIKKAGKIRIAIDLGVPPYGMTDAQMKPTGLDVEAAEMLAKDWGLHLIDANIAMGNLVEVVGQQSKAYLAKK